MFTIVFGTILIMILISIALANQRDNTTFDGAPFVPLEPDVIERIMNMLDIKKGDVFYDLGSGDGRVVIAAASKGAKAYGIEIDKARVWYSRFWIFVLGLSGKAKIINKSIFDVDLSNADAINVYLLQETNDKLQKKLKKELKKNTRVLSAAFEFKKWKPEEIDIRGPIYGPLRLYKNKKK